MSILLLPSTPWVQRAGVVAPAEVQAQTIPPVPIGGCTASSISNSIIREYCTPDGHTNYFCDLTQLESEAVKAFLASHHLPETDASVIYDYGRSDLRSQIRALISSILVGIVKKDPSQRTLHEQQLYSWLQSWVHPEEIALYTTAVAHFQSLVNDPCRFTPDKDLATSYGISYDGSPFCGSSFSTFFGLPVPVVPSVSYFTAYGLKHSYLKRAATDPSYVKLLADLNVGLAVVAGAVALGGIGVGTGLGLAGSYAAALAAWTTGTATNAGLAGSSSAFILSGGTVESVGTAGLVAGPVVIILIAIAIGVAAGVQVFNYQDSINQLNTLKTTLTRVTNEATDLKGLVTDAKGLYKLQNIVLARTLPDVPSTKPLPAHRDGIDALFFEEVFFQRPFSYRDWDENIWTARTWGGWIVQTCRDGATSKKCSQADSITADLHYRQPTPIHPGEFALVNWTASRFGSNFTHTRAQLWRGYDQQPCEADAATGKSTQLDLSRCSSYVYPSISYEAGDGSFMMTDLEIYSAVFSKPTYLSFTAGVPSTQTITLASTPNKSNVSVDQKNGGTLPSNPDFTIITKIGLPDFNTLDIKFNGNPNAANQDYTLNVYAEFFPVTETYTISLRNELKITSPGSLNATAGAPVNFLVTATGSPAPKLSIDPEALVDGLTFTDNGNGTATIAGVPPLPGEFQCSKIDLSTGTSRPCAIFATNSQGTVQQPFTINLASAPTASVAPPIGATFTAGVYNQVLLTATGATTPVSWTFFPDPNAPWLSLQDNGTGTAQLKGTPPLGTTGMFSPGAVPTALGSRGIGPVFPITVVSAAQFTSPNTTTFTVGTAGSFAVTANIGTIESDGSLPTGLSFTSGNPAGISGVPAVGTGGQYVITLTDDVGGGETATQSLILNVNEAPKIKSGTTATMFVGTPGSFAVTTTGYPSVSNHVFPVDTLLPPAPDQVDGMSFTVTGLPAALTFTNLNPQGFATGTLTIQGTPTMADIGAHQVKITAENGVGGAAQQTLMLNIVGITGPAPTSGATCNGNYTGTFKGNITVSAGQNCSFYFGGVTGSVQVLGGSFAATGANITGNVSIQGAAGFSIGAGTTIAGNLSIQNVGSGATSNQMCGTTVQGNVNISANAVPMTIGSAAISCLGNTFGGNAAITSNTAPIQFYENDVRKNLSCSSNASIAGSGNTAQKKNGQCAGF